MNRRTFIKQLFGGIAAALAVPFLFRTKEESDFSKNYVAGVDPASGKDRIYVYGTGQNYNHREAVYWMTHEFQAKHNLFYQEKERSIWGL